MNLINETHHLYERRKYVFMVIRKYTIIFYYLIDFFFPKLSSA